MYNLLSLCYHNYWKLHLYWNGRDQVLLNATMTIGQRFKLIRSDKGLSQAEVAEGICSSSVISQIETDRKYPSAEMMGKLADKLGVPMREIMGMQETQMEVGFQIEMIRVYIQKGDFERALDIIDELCRRIDLLEHQRVDLLVCRADGLLKAKNYDEVVELLLPFVELQAVHQSVVDETLCDLYNKLGNALFRLNDFGKAYSVFEQGYRISLKLPDFGLVAARVSKNLGLTCLQIGYREDARLHLEKAYAFFDRVADMREVANTLFDMARATGNPEYMSKARSVYEGLNMVREANLAKQHYAFHFKSKHNYIEAVDEIRESATVFESLGERGLSIYTYSRAVKVCMDNGDIEEAVTILDLAIKGEEVLEQKNPFMISYFYRVKGELNLQLKRFEESIADSIKSSEMYDTMGLYGDSADALEISAKAYEMLGDYVKSHKILSIVVNTLRKANNRGNELQ